MYSELTAVLNLCPENPVPPSRSLRDKIFRAPPLAFSHNFNMKSTSALRLALAFFFATFFISTVRAGHPFIAADSYANRVSVISSNGAVEWSFNCKHPQDCWRLANGNYLFCHEGGALEMTPDKKIAWEYRAGTNTQIHACQPLPDGRVLVVENGPCRILELDRAGKIAKEIKLTPPPANVSLHDQFRGTRKTLGGHYLVSRKGEHRVEELDGEGKSLRSISVPGDVHETVLLPDGHLLIACGDGHKIIELDANEKIVWSVDENEIPGHTLRLAAGLQRLPNGNTVICNYLGHGHLGEQAHVFELTPDKKVVWEVTDQKNFKVINQIQLLDVPGDPARGGILR